VPPSSYTTSLWSSPDPVRIELHRVWHRVSTLFYRVGDQGRGSVFQHQPSAASFRGRVRPLISLAHPAPNQVPRLVCAAPPRLVPADWVLSLTRTHSNSSSSKLAPGCPG
jgi:hypothetical protein